MSIDWQDLLKQLGSTAIIVSALAYVARQGIDQWLAQRLTQHKSSLDEAAARALEQLRSDLRLVEAQRSRLLTKQASVIAGTFARLERLHETMRRLAAPINHGQGGAHPIREEAIAAFNEFTAFYYQRAIWLDPDICTQLNDAVGLLAKLLNNMNYNLQPNGEIADKNIWVSTYNRLDKEVPEVRRALDAQFRRILGVDTAGGRLLNESTKGGGAT
jgi:hypothetical protein